MALRKPVGDAVAEDVRTGDLVLNMVFDPS